MTRRYTWNGRPVKSTLGRAALSVFLFVAMTILLLPCVLMDCVLKRIGRRGFMYRDFENPAVMNWNVEKEAFRKVEDERSSFWYSKGYDDAGVGIKHSKMDRPHPAYWQGYLDSEGDKERS